MKYKYVSYRNFLPIYRNNLNFCRNQQVNGKYKQVKGILACFADFFLLNNLQKEFKQVVMKAAFRIKLFLIFV